MTVITEPLRHHHTLCDDLFAVTEAAAAEKNWTQCQALLTRFRAVIESHFRCEEETLFPAFEAITGMAGGPTQMMRIEHARMRELLAQMQAALTAQAADNFAGAAETLLVFMQQHNLKEENILYPMCDRALTAQATELSAQLLAGLDSACPTPS
jgi:hemerythrin-like domain-containing protein